VLTNLVGKAIKYIDEGSVVVQHLKAAKVSTPSNDNPCRGRRIPFQERLTTTLSAEGYTVRAAGAGRRAAMIRASGTSNRLRNHDGSGYDPGR
jgi:hypothetical protein